MHSAKRQGDPPPAQPHTKLTDRDLGSGSEFQGTGPEPFEALTLITQSRPNDEYKHHFAIP